MPRTKTLAAAMLVLLTSSVASANGRFPSANQLVFNPKDPESMLVRATFGMLRTHDAGRNASLICDLIIGSSSVVDPGVGIFEDGTYTVATPDGLGVSHDDGCSFSFIGGELAKQKFIDVSIDKQNGARAIALTATLLPNSGGEYVRIFETLDSGATWKAVGPALDPNQLVTTLDIAPTRAQRLYLSGSTVTGSKLHGFFAASDDDGATWATTLLPDLPNVYQFYIAGVDPIDPDVVYLRSYFADSGPSTLLVTTNGGKTFSVATTIDGNMQGFALSPDGTRVAVGSYYGTLVASRPFAVIRDASADADGDGGAPAGPDASTPWQFEARSTRPVGCLGWRKDNKLFACGSGVPKGCGPGDGTALLASSDDEAATWTPIIPLLADIQEPLKTCAADTTSAKICGPDWPRQHEILKCAYTKADAGADAGTIPDAGPIVPPAPPPDDCDCSTPGAVRGGSFAMVLAAAAMFVFRLRRKRR